MGDLTLPQFTNKYDGWSMRVMVDTLQRTFTNISTVVAFAMKGTYQLFANIVPGSSVGSAETVMMSYTLPANTLALDGYNITVEAWGTFAANTHNKRVRLYFGSTVVYDTTSLAVNGGTWKIESTIVRTGTSAEQAITFIICSNTTVVNSVTYVVPNELLSATIDVSCSGLGVSNGDIIENGLLVKLFPQR